MKFWPTFVVLLLSTPAWGSPPAAETLDSATLEQAAAWLVEESQRARLGSSPTPPQLLGLFPDPDPGTLQNELLDAIALRSAQVIAEGWTPLDDRARLLFLRGAPSKRLQVDCAETFQPLELWTYPSQEVLLATPKARHVMRLWLPLDGKAGLYTHEMRYWLDQWHSYGKRISGTRFDRQICPESEEVDRVTGTDGLLGSAKHVTPSATELLAFVAPPLDLAAWASAVLAGPRPELPSKLPVEVGSPLFPLLDGPRIRTRLVLTIPSQAELGVLTDDTTKRRTVRLRVEGTLEHGGNVLEPVRARYELPLGPDSRPDVALVVERGLRPGLAYIARLDVIDEIGGARDRVVIAFEVPREPIPVPEPVASDGTRVELAENLAAERVTGIDTVLLLAPGDDVVFGRWRAEAIVTGARIARVSFSLDGKLQLTRRSPPYTVELDLPAVPQPLVVRAEGFDAGGQSVAFDEIVLNQPRGELEVTIAEPGRGVTPRGAFVAAVEVVVPEGRRIESVEIGLSTGGTTVLERPPWSVELVMPPAGELVWLSAVATLDDGSSAEDTRFLRVPGAFEEVDVRLVELYTTVSSRDGRLARGLEAEDFRVLEDGRPQSITKFELVEDLPLVIGLTIDASGSMYASLGEAQRAATGFLEGVVGPRDQSFAVGFATRPALLMGRTSDVGAVEIALRSLVADGWTSLHDAVVFSLYYFRGAQGRKALVLLSDGDDTSSQLDFDQALAYAQRSGVVVYTIGLRNDSLDLAARRKLAQLSATTGGRPFLIEKAEELSSVYAEIEAELRSQYLLAYAPDRPPSQGFRKVEVKVEGAGLSARTIPGYAP